MNAANKHRKEKKMEKKLLLGLIILTLSACTAGPTAPGFEDHAPGEFWFIVESFDDVEVRLYSHEYDTTAEVGMLFRLFDFEVDADCEEFLVARMRVWRDLGYLTVGQDMQLISYECRWHYEY